MNKERFYGEVISFRQGFGFIQVPGGESYFVHWSNIADEMKGYRELFPMDKVSFTVGEGKDGRRQAMDVVLIQEG